MTTRNAADRYLKCRNGKWQYYRRVPKEFAEHDNRGTIRVSLKTDSLTLARSKRDALAEADEQLWMTLASAKGSIARLLDPATSQILKRYEAARHRAMSKGYIYTPADQLAETANLEEIVSRLLELPSNPKTKRKRLKHCSEESIDRKFLFQKLSKSTARKLLLVILSGNLQRR